MRRSDPQIPCLVVAPLLRYVAARGGDVAELRRRNGLAASAGDGPEVMLSLAARAQIFDDAAALLGDPFVGLHLALTFEPGTFGVLEHDIASAADLRDAHRRLVAHSALINPLARYKLIEDSAGTAELRHRMAGTPTGAGRHLHELTLAVLFLGARRLAGPFWRTDRIWFLHPRPDLDAWPDAPDPVVHLAAVFGTSDIGFGAADNGLAFPTALLDLPVLSAAARRRPLALVPNPADCRDADDAGATAAGTALAAGSDLVARVEPVVRALLPRGGGLLVEVAARLGMSPRTLQRRLASDGSSLHEIVEAERRDAALRLLRDPGRPLAEIAYRLGYSDMANFLRAFKRWTGATPGQRRRAVASGAA